MSSAQGGGGDFRRKYNREHLTKQQNFIIEIGGFAFLGEIALTHQKNVMRRVYDVNLEIAQPSILHRIFEKNPYKFCIKKDVKIESYNCIKSY